MKVESSRDLKRVVDALDGVASFVEQVAASLAMFAGVGEQCFGEAFALVLQGAKEIDQLLAGCA